MKPLIDVPEMNVGNITNEQLNDFISRKWLMECLEEGWFDTEKDYNRMIHLVRDTAPSVQPERKKGKWLLSDEQRREDTDNGNYLYFCSNCLRSDIHAKTQEVPFCWWCGADMRSE